MKIVNLTPHTINVVLSGELREFAPSGQIARVTAKSVTVGEIDGIPVVRTEFGAIEGLPEQEDGTVYIVSTIVAQAARRPDVVSPDTGPTAIRKDGLVTAVRHFQTF